MSNIFTNYQLLLQWLDIANMYPFAHRFLSKRRLYLFIFAADATGILHEYMIDADGQEVYSDAIYDLSENLKSFQLFKQLERTGVPPIRTSSNVSDEERQVSHLPSVGDPSDIAFDVEDQEQVPSNEEKDRTEELSIRQGDVVFAPYVPKQPSTSHASSGNGSAVSPSKDSARPALALCIVLKVIRETGALARYQVYNGQRKWSVSSDACVSVSYSSAYFNWTAREFDLFISGLKKYYEQPLYALYSYIYLHMIFVYNVNVLNISIYMYVHLPVFHRYEDDLQEVHGYMQSVIQNEYNKGSNYYAGVVFKKSLKDIYAIYHLFNQNEEFVFKEGFIYKKKNVKKLTDKPKIKVYLCLYLLMYTSFTFGYVCLGKSQA